MLEPVGQKVIIEIITRAEKLAAQYKKSAGLLVPTENVKQDEPNQGVVYAISKAIKEPGFKVGDTVVFFTKEIFQGFEYDGKKLVKMELGEIRAVMEVA